MSGMEEKIMAATKKTTNKSGKNSKKKKNSSDDTMKFLLVLVIAGIAIALIILSQKDNPAGGLNNGTPTPTIESGITEEPENTPAEEPTAVPTTEPVQQPDATPEPTAMVEPTAAPEPTATPTPTNTPTPTPTPALSAAEAENTVKGQVDTSVYNVQLVNENLVVGNERYYQFGAIKNQEFVYPFLVVSQADGSLHFYDSTEGTVFDFTKFPSKAEVTPTPTLTPAPSGALTAKEAYEILCTYSKDALCISKEVREYDAEYGDELTLIDGVDCYRINLSEFSNGKVRNRGEFYVSVDGTKCYYIDSDTNEFVEAVK
jgi:hypothetical protein